MTQIQQAQIVHDVAVDISPLVRRITASNSGVMTGPGTNTYIVGREQLAVIDPGPADAAHIAAILKTCNARLRWILTTHTHPDHSPAAAQLAAATGAVVLGNKIADDGRQDTSFNPLRGFAHDELFITDEFRLRAIATPGHVGNHLCFLLEDEQLLFTGDHIMQGSTVVIVPPNGDMQDYLNSLALLLQYPIAALAPAHGQIITEPQAETVPSLLGMMLCHQAMTSPAATAAVRTSRALRR